MCHRDLSTIVSDPGLCRRPSLRGWAIIAPLLICLCVVAGALRAADDPLAELHRLARVEGIDPAKLRRGDILSARGTQGSFAHGAYAESCYFIKAPLAKVGDALLHWDPSKYKEADTTAYTTYRWPAGPETFRRFRLSSARGDDKALLGWTQAAATGDEGALHLTAAERETFRGLLAGKSDPKAREEALNAGWQGVLAQQSAAMGAGGFAAIPPYKANGGTIHAAAEYRGLLGMTPTTAAHFAGLTGARPLFPDGEGAADETLGYAEHSKVNGHNSFGLGVLAARKGAEGWQVVDCTYYTTDTFFMSVAVYQLWAWEGGTLVWEIDYTSAPFRAYLGGIDRAFASKEISKDSAGAVRLFRREVGAAGN